MTFWSTSSLEVMMSGRQSPLCKRFWVALGCHPWQHIASCSRKQEPEKKPKLTTQLVILHWARQLELKNLSANYESHTYGEMTGSPLDAPKTPLLLLRQPHALVQGWWTEPGSPGSQPLLATLLSGHPVFHCTWESCQRLTSSVWLLSIKYENQIKMWRDFVTNPKHPGRCYT